MNDKYKYYNSGYCRYEINLDDSSWERLQLVSVDKNNEVIGYMTACIDRMSNIVTSIGAINFKDVNITFSKDFRIFLKSLFEEYNFYKIEWRVIVGNPAEKMYDKICNKYGGRIVGIFKQSVYINGDKYDEKLYEILKLDYDKN